MSRGQVLNGGCWMMACFAVLAGTLTAADWPQWRGPDRNGVSRETGWSANWPESGPTIAWRANVGIGFSSVTIANGRLATMGSDGASDTVYCLDAKTGEQLWTHAYEAPLDDKYFEGGPTATPTFDGDTVYALSRRGNVMCFNAQSGEVNWELDVREAADVRLPSWGFCGSPVVVGQLLLLNVGESGVALHKQTGDVVWSSGDRDAGYTTPLPFQQGDRHLALISSGRFVQAVDIRTGEVVWKHRWLTRFGANAADPVLAGDRVFVSSGYNRGSALLRLAEGEPDVLWKTKEMQNQFSSSVLIDEHLYGIDGDTTGERQLKCLALATGEVAWSVAGYGSGALMAAGGKLIILSESGELTIAPASPRGLSPVARAQVLDGKCWTVPVLANARIYCRNANGDLVCVDVAANE